MNISIEKISNGYVVTIDDKKTFHDVPESICGATSEWVLAHCEKLLEAKAASSDAVPAWLRSTHPTNEAQARNATLTARTMPNIDNCW